MKILALIPARGGSKRLPGKNNKLLLGKPLIRWTLDITKNLSGICDVLVSTDSAEILETIQGTNALAPWLRPSSLSSDTASSSDVAIHALDWYEETHSNVDGLLLLQPTSPFRSKETIERGIALFESNELNTVIGVSDSKEHPMWTFKKENGILVPFCEPNGFGSRSQDLPNTYVANGGFYLIQPKRLRQQKNFIGGGMIDLIINSPIESLDIDNEWDFWLAEIYAQRFSEKQNYS